MEYDGFDFSLMSMLDLDWIGELRRLVALW